MLELGFRPGDRVALWMATSAGWFVTNMAITLADSTVVAISTPLSNGEVADGAGQGFGLLLRLRTANSVAETHTAPSSTGLTSQKLRARIVRGEIPDACMSWSVALDRDRTVTGAATHHRRGTGAQSPPGDTSHRAGGGEVPVLGHPRTGPQGRRSGTVGDEVEAALNAFAVTFADRMPAAEDL